MIQHIYDMTIRNHVPRKIQVFNGVAVRKGRLLDRTDHFPEHKQVPLTELNNAVADGDSVTIVGGGWGVSTVKALRAGAGEVVAYEAALSMIDFLEETLAMNCTDEQADRVRVEHAVVEAVHSAFGELDAPRSVGADDLPASDVLYLDCEGAEVDILQALDDAPPTIVCETHPNHGSTATHVRDLLDASGHATAVTEMERHDWPEGKATITARQVVSA